MIGIIILNYKTWEKTISCISSINNTYLSPKKIVVVDNASPNESYERLQSEYAKAHDVTIIQTESNKGFASGNNFGFDYLIHTYPDIEEVIITNNDVIFCPDSIQRLITSFSLFPDVVMTAPSIYDPQGHRTNKPWKKEPNLKQILGFKSINECLYEWDEITGDMPVYMVSGCCFAVNAPKFEKIGKLDEKTFLYNEEHIISHIIKENGLSIIFCPDANVIHEHGITTGKSNIFVDKEYSKSSLYFLYKYKGVNRYMIYLISLFYRLRIILKFCLRKYTGKYPLVPSLVEISEYREKLLQTT